LIQLNAVLNLPELRLGWQRSTFIERYCSYTKKCATPVSITKSESSDGTADFWLYVVRWFAGLTVSVMLLFLGAPFWADRLRDLLRLRSTVEQNKKAGAT
jgi:hypothetical protein